MNKPFKPGEELISLNEELHTEFAIVELEQRLETDPLLVAGLLNNTSSSHPMCTGNSQLMVCQDDSRFAVEIDPDADSGF